MTFEPLNAIPTTYVYVGQLQEARKALDRALAACSDQSTDGMAAAAAVNEARQRIENIYKLDAEGIRA
jgi:hypothetical protein